MQDVLADPPFARLDLISCRNLLIYLKPEAQAKALAVFHFALREGGLLLVGNAETVAPAVASLTSSRSLIAFIGASGKSSRRVRAVRKPWRGSPHARSTGRSFRAIAASGPGGTLPKARSGDYGPAAVLINSKLECLHFQGPRISISRWRPAGRRWI